MPFPMETWVAAGREAGQTWSFRGSKSRNKVSVGEPAEGSLTNGLGTFKTLQTIGHEKMCFGAPAPPLCRNSAFLCLNVKAKNQNFQQRISWLLHR